MHEPISTFCLFALTNLPHSNIMKVSRQSKLGNLEHMAEGENLIIQFPEADRIRYISRCKKQRLLYREKHRYIS